MSRLYCGTSGWIYQHWKRRFYPADLPQGRWLEYYCRYFDTVEINNSFYRLPEKSTFERWRGESPEDFTFTVKASRFLTHMKKLKDPEEPLERLLTHSSGLAEKRGPILYQLPPYWKLNLARLQDFLIILDKDIRHVFEFRDNTWQIEAVWSLLEQYNAGYCIMDAPGLPNHIRTTADFSYIRMHGGTGDEWGNYTDEHLALYARRIEDLLTRGDVYIYFNNDAYAHALTNAITLKSMLQ